MKRSLLLLSTVALGAGAFAQTGDLPPVDIKQLLQALRQFRDQNEAATKTRLTTAYQQVTAAASSNEKAAAAWEEAVLAVQFAGVDHQTTAVRAWKQDEGEALRSKEGANAARLHLHWLGLSLQHSSGAETKQLLNNIIEFARQVEADRDMMEKFEAQLEKLRERAPAGKRAPGNKDVAEDTRVKRLHDSIMRTPVTNGPVARKLQIVELLGDLGGKRKKGDGEAKKADAEGATGWEPVPGNVDGIYRSIVLPEFRATKDPRLLEYWDLQLKLNNEKVVPGMPSFEERQITQVRRPALMWSRAQDILLLGQRNRAATEMFNIIKAYPLHPDAAGWMKQLEEMIAPPAVSAPAASATPAAIPTATVIPAPAGQPAPR
jgi:hypothetical protein